MDIALGLDEKYVMPGGVLMTSINKTNADTPINFHILSETLTEKSKELLRACVNDPAQSSVHFYSITDWKERGLMPEGFHFSIATYYRLFIAHLLPSSVSKVLYLDSDILVVDSLKPLWDTDITDHPVAAGIDLHNDEIRDFNRLEYDIQYGYFNSGMLLMNLDIWRKEGLSDKILTFITEHTDRCKFYDQDALNYVLHGRIKRVSYRYNVQEFSAVEHVGVRKSLHEDLLESCRRPAIIHFIGGIKPWHTDSKSAYRDLWRYVQRQTPWATVKYVPAFSPLDRFAFLRWAKRVVRSAITNPDNAQTYAPPLLDSLYERLR